jgi:hypothetical protein
MMPLPNQSLDSYLEGCDAASGAGLSRATPDEIAAFKFLGYSVQGHAGVFQWHHEDGSFQDDIESYSEADSWALVKDKVYPG